MQRQFSRSLGWSRPCIAGEIGQPHVEAGACRSSHTSMGPPDSLSASDGITLHKGCPYSRRSAQPPVCGVPHAALSEPAGRPLARAWGTHGSRAVCMSGGPVSDLAVGQGGWLVLGARHTDIRGDSGVIWKTGFAGSGVNHSCQVVTLGDPPRSRTRHYSYGTEQCYVDWVQRFFAYLSERQHLLCPQVDSGAASRDFLTDPRRARSGCAVAGSAAARLESAQAVAAAGQ